MAQRLTKAQNKYFSELAEAVDRYLQSMGWRVLVVGNPRIQHQLTERPYNYEFVLRFTGAPKPTSTKKKTAGRDARR